MAAMLWGWFLAFIAFLNTPLGLTIAIAALGILYRKLMALRPDWKKYEGRITCLVREAEKLLPAPGADGINRLQWVLAQLEIEIQKQTGDTIGAELREQLWNGISLVHDRVFPKAAKIGPAASLAALLEAVKKSGAALLLLTLPCLSGCWNAPEPVLKGHDQAAVCVTRAAANYNATIAGLEGALRAERRGHADYALEKAYDNVRRDGAANAGKVDAEKVLAYIKSAHAARDKTIQDLEATLAGFRQAAAAGDREAAIALGLMGELRKYDAAGVDPVKTATEAVQAAGDLVPGLKPGDLK